MYKSFGRSAQRAMHVVLLGIVALQCNCREKRYVRAQIIDADEFAIYAVQRSSDSTYSEEMTADDGSTWFRETAAGLDLRHISLIDVHAVEDPDGKGIVVIPIKPEYYDILSKWSRDRVGGEVLFVFKGQIVGSVVRLEAELRSVVTVQLDTPSQASQLADALTSYTR